MTRPTKAHQHDLLYPYKQLARVYQKLNDPATAEEFQKKRDKVAERLDSEKTEKAKSEPQGLSGGQ